ncbi:GH35 family endo-1,4-beta-xylanase [Actinoplanes octamycinicus]|uniref:Beta-xylanase n=1 Tax=Actinoplanes octamycinicus TaxID=135948 RepID=A0A7W7H0H3_9ACTN|nr:endo-1,4-beta-xylanase [Actinoplanes octamycinicus]MBB4741599.1 GH35 family endo-1,4-beta-xylanase [Actinoplanes octamycinicus]GIE57151.1 beta-xylanase [Actinoplanes octamycinicus]
MRHRSGEVLATVVDAGGQPLRDREVVVEQRTHAFAFGNIGFDFVPLANGEPGQPAGALADLWLDVFNTATLPFYWAGFEPERGRPDTRRLRRTAQWFTARGCRVKGHPLVWHTLTPGWLSGLRIDEVEAAVRARIRREVADFADVVHTWDAINEAVIMPVFRNEERPNEITRLARAWGRIATIRLAFQEARAADPTATLVLNDFDTSTAYECLIEGVLEAGVRIDAIGLQSHMHQGYWGEERTLAILERFARYGLPLHLTETTLLSGDLMPPEIEDLNDYQPPSWPSTPEGEQRQAEEIVRHYRTLLAHPSVQAITYWGLTDRGAWLGAPAGLVRADGTPKPAYHALRDLVKGEWWRPPTTLRTDDAGGFPVRGFLGDYQVRCAGRTAHLAITAPGRTTSTLRLG